MRVNLPEVMVTELRNCPRNDCRVMDARGETGLNILSNNALLECLSCKQVWEVEQKGGDFTHWDKNGRAHISPVSYSIGSKWPKGESQCESIAGAFALKKKFVDAKR